ncbi:hypothetical protein KVR01_007582 [Diaporthe batatas]|uniref:uncharacterized protein n=1 Tax=Diaporthe batatas TaxID=748121 RepID=UPI001D0362F0|nr:uncharacterized protein KVR01_007582 [Diaporthe batatas]KAG8163104.1 hypothetical protein KVR01_007582 [Diaporthe batatas]
MPRKGKISEPVVIHHLGGLLELRVLETIKDGKEKRSNVFLVECRGSQKTQSAPALADRSATCVLKTFPPSEFHNRLFEREVAAYTELQRPSAAVDPEGAWAVLSTYDAESSSWPFCFGRLGLPDTAEPLQAGGGWIRPGPHNRPVSVAKQRQALLLEYMADSSPLTTDRLNYEIAGKIRQIIHELHTRRVVHGDFVDHCLWPRIGFGNIFLQKRKGSGVEEVFVMDFNRSRIIGPHPRDQAMALEEEQQMDDLLRRALESKMAIDEVPRELRKLSS